MAKIPRRKVVRETEAYDDLLSESELTRALLQDKKGKLKTKLFGKKVDDNRDAAGPIKVHLRDKRAAQDFALLIRQRISTTRKQITFSGKLYTRSRRVIIASKIPLLSARFEDHRKTAPRKTPRKQWNQDSFFNRTWIDMPPFENEALSTFATFQVSFPSLDDKIAFAQLIKQQITPATKSIYFPANVQEKKSTLVWIGREKTNKPRYPVFIVSKGRAHLGPLTADVLQDLNVPFYLMVEPHEYDKYRVLCDAAEDIFVIPDSNHGQGPGRARNACWDVAKNVFKSKRHWVLDDNIAGFFRLHQNERIRVGDGTIFRVAEDFVDRYTNIAVAGLGYKFFHPASEKQYPLKVNTRIYSCLLIDNNCPYRWRGRYNEDTILSLDVLKDIRHHETHEELNARDENGNFITPRNERFCTVEFVALLQDKLRTQTQKGGNTAEFYQKEGTAAKSAMLVDVHPDVAKPTILYDREHHDVDYTVFRSNWLIKTDQYKRDLERRDWQPYDEENPYGMVLVDRSKLKR